MTKPGLSVSKRTTRGTTGPPASQRASSAGPNIEDLDEILSKFYAFVTGVDENGYTKDEAKAALQAHIERKQAEAVKANNELHKFHERNIEEVVLKARIDENFACSQIMTQYWKTTEMLKAASARRAKLQATNPTKHAESQGGSDE